MEGREETAVGSGPKPLALSCSVSFGPGPAFYSYITPGAKRESSQVTQVVFFNLDYMSNTSEAGPPFSLQLDLSNV